MCREGLVSLNTSAFPLKMKQSCDATHPSQPSIYADSSPHSPCVICSLHVLTNPNALPTIRRAAARAITPLIEDISRLSRLKLSFLDETVERLLHGLYQLPPAENALASDLSKICVSIATELHASCGPHFCALIFSEAVTGAMIDNTCAYAPFAFGLLAQLLRECKHHDIQPDPFPDLFAVRLLSECMGDVNMYEDAILLLDHALQSGTEDGAEQLLRAAENCLPPRRTPLTDKLFLNVCHHLTQLKPELLITSSSLSLVLKHSFISMALDIRQMACKIVNQLCKAGFTDSLIRNSTFEYVIEGIRNRESEDMPIDLLLQSVAALTSLSEAPLVERWVYSLEPILDLVPILGSQVRLLIPIVCVALHNAPTPMFTTSILASISGFVMRIVACDESPAKLIDAISLLLSRFRLDGPSIHTLLPIAEGTAQSGGPVACVSPFLANLCSQYSSLVQQSSDRSRVNDLLLLGRRLILSVFDGWAGALEGTLNTFDVAVSVHGSIDSLCGIMDMFTSALDSSFVTVNACQLDDMEGMILWCWTYFPPRVVFACFHDVHCSEVQQTSMKRYLHRIGISENLTLSDEIDEFPLSEGDFLQFLGGQCREPLHFCAVQLCQKAIELNHIDSLCQPDRIVNALVKSVQSTLRNKSNLSWDVCELVRNITVVCSRHGLCIPLGAIPEESLLTTVNREGFSFTDATDVDIFRWIVSRPKKSRLDVASWDALVKCCKTSHYAKSKSRDLILCTGREAFVAESLSYALQHSMDPFGLAMCLLHISEDSQSLRIALGRALEKAGCLDLLLKALISADCAGVTGHENHALASIRAASFLWIFSSTPSISNSQTRLNVFAAVCDSFIKESTAFHGSKQKAMYLSALCRYLVAAICTMEENHILPTIRRTNIIEKALCLIRRLAILKMTCNQLIAICGTFVLSLLRTERVCGTTFLNNNVMADVLKDEAMWEKLLSSFPSAPNADSASRISICCYLMEVLLSYVVDDIDLDRIQVSLIVVTVLSVASCSLYSFLREAATFLLSRIMTIFGYKSIEGSSALSSVSTYRQAATIILNRILRENMIDAWDLADCLLLATSIDLGVVDSDLDLIQKHLSYVSACSKKNSENGEDKTVLLSALLELLKITTARQQRFEGLAKPVNISVTISSDWKVNAEPILGHYTVLWRRQYCRR